MQGGHTVAVDGAWFSNLLSNIVGASGVLLCPSVAVILDLVGGWEFLGSVDKHAFRRSAAFEVVGSSRSTAGLSSVCSAYEDRSFCVVVWTRMSRLLGVAAWTMRCQN